MAKAPRSPVNVDVDIKAGARLDVKAEVPSTSVGRFVDALTDLFRPFSEAQGLRADQIRLQRADVAIEIAKRARATMAVEKMEASPVPNKILIPLIEKGSNENLDDEFMIERWGNLLASASSSDEVEPRFVGILGELRGRQARALQAIAKNCWDQFDYPAHRLVDVAVVLDAVNVRKFLNNLFFDRRFSPQVNDIYTDLIDLTNVPGAGITDIIIFDSDEKMYSLTERDRLDLGDFSDLDIEILSSLGLLKRVNCYYNSKFKHEIQIIYFHLTEFGIKFFLCCNRDIRLKTEDHE